ncbi:subtilisin-like serine protease [Ceratobasidium sp. 428]|nr:subtilisin-like serine protease [Ceratobasidium sp. 428]
MLVFASAVLAVVLPVFAAPTGNVPITKFAGRVKANSYIIKLKDGVSRETHLNAILPKFVADSGLKYKYGDVFHGYAATLKGQDLALVRQSKDIEFIEEDGIARIDNISSNASGSSESALPAVNPHSVRASDGAGVDIYIIDTGIYTAHNSFGGRARWGATFGGYANADGNGHGTHVAGTAVGASYGVATGANVVAVKVLSDSGSGSNSDIISGVNYVYNAFKTGGRSAVMNLSVGGAASTAVDSAVSNAIAGGVHATVAAGGSNADAGTTSPGRVEAANTVGAVDSSNRRASFSSYGPIIDVWAPGVNILSTWIGSPTATNTISGTSSSAPFVAGILAVAISEYGNKSPAQLSADLKSHARAVVTNVPSGTTNLLATRW